MAELGLSENKDKNINYPVYISPKVLKRSPIQLGITIKNKEEIFIQRPLSINNLEQELNKWSEELNNSRKKISQLTITEKLNQDLAQENNLLKIELQGEKQMGQAQKATNQAKRFKRKLIISKLNYKKNFPGGISGLMKSNLQDMAKN